MPNTKVPVERRKHRRFRVLNDTFVLLKSNRTSMGPLKEITMQGLSFHYVGSTQVLTKHATLSIISPDNSFYVYVVPCKIISDLKLNSKHPGPIGTRRCGVQFGELTPDQICLLGYFIQKLTTSGIS